MRARREEELLPLTGHLLALRKALLTCVGAVLAAFLLVYAFASDPLMAWVVGPIRSRGIEIIYTTLSEALVTRLKVALIAGCVLASPLVFWQVWRFVAPALYEHERCQARALLGVAVLLFLMGVAFCCFAIYSLAVDLFLVQGENLASPMLSIDKYVGFLFGFLVPFGVAFLLPVALYATTKAGLTDYRTLASKRKLVLLGIFVLAAVLTPPDVVSQVALGVPLYLLYEISLQVARATGLRHARQSADE